MSAALSMQSPDADLVRFANDCIAAAWKGVAVAQDFKREVLKRIEAKHFVPSGSLDQELAEPVAEPIVQPDDQDAAGAHDASLQQMLATDAVEEQDGERFDYDFDGGWR